MIQGFIFLLYLSSLEAKKPELPLCPSNMQFFPQNLPMHCRMPVPPSPASHEAIPLPAPPYTGPIPGPAPMPMPMPLPMGPLPPAPVHKLPVIVMPLYSPEKNPDQLRRRRKKRRPGLKRRPKHYYTSDEDSTYTDTSSDDSSENGWWKRSRDGRRSNRHKSKRRRNQKKELLTPVLQYVTRDGYVIFEKQISKGEAKEWLVNKDDNNKRLESSKVKHNSESKELRDDIEDTKFLAKEEDNIEVRTEVNSHHKKINVKRKPTANRHN